ncbi:MAG: competence protein ComEC [Rikenellaceae bacterium]|nr:competence protein ComEC [Rikenellaceae bacterium]MDN5355188.1 competence protein ComEC [Rikenellaceae bacterium]
MNWSKAPIARIVLLYIIGISIYHFWPNHSIYYFITLTTTFLLFISYGFYLFYTKYIISSTQFLSIAIFIAILSLGYFRSYSIDEKNRVDYYENYIDKASYLYGDILNTKSFSQTQTKATVKINKMLIDSQWINTNGKVLLYLNLPVDSFNRKSHSILFRNSIQSPNEIKFPYEFDYAKYLANLQIYHIGYINDYDFKIIERKSNILEKFLIFRNKLIKLIYENIQDNTSANLISAMLLGYKDVMDADIIKDFQHAGVVHILSISGLHVAIIYGAIYLLFSLIIPLKYKNKIAIPLALITLWLYTLMVGAMPSVVRSAIMLTLLQISPVINRNVNKYNSLAAAALIILIFNPLQLYSLGFQLSFSAVLGIFFFYTPLINIFKTHKKWLKWVIGSLSVTMAAQLGTLPFTLFYFHQFPTYFIIANLIAVPFASLLIYAEFITLIFAFIPVIGEYISIIFSFLVKIFINFIRIISDLPYSTISNIFLTPLSAIMIGIMIILITIKIYFKEIKIFPYFLTAVLLFGITYNFSLIKRIQYNPSFESLNYKYAIIGQKEQQKFNYLVIKPDSVDLPNVQSKIDDFCTYYFCKEKNKYEINEKVKTNSFYVNNPIISNADNGYIIGNKKEINNLPDSIDLKKIEIDWWKLKFR